MYHIHSLTFFCYNRNKSGCLHQKQSFLIKAGLIAGMSNLTNRKGSLMDQFAPTFHLDLKNPEITALVCKALSSEVRLKILELLTDYPKNISDLATLLGIPMSTMTTHIRLLEQANIISVSSLPGSRGTQKRCSLAVNYIQMTLNEPQASQYSTANLIASEEMPIGNYFDYEVTAPCGIISYEDSLIPADDPSRFSSPERIKAQLIWLTTGYLEYRFPLDAAYPFRSDVERIEFSFEVCSETFGYNEFWHSDVSVWINNHEIGYIECPGDHGGRRGFLNPEWWSNANTQYGDLATIIITKNGCTINSHTTEEFNVSTLHIGEGSYVSLKLGVKKDAQFSGGMNLFGEKFGDHPQAIIMKVYGHPQLTPSGN